MGKTSLLTHENKDLDIYNKWKCMLLYFVGTVGVDQLDV